MAKPGIIPATEDDLSALPPGFAKWDRYTRSVYLRRMRWLATARPSQVTPAGDWKIFLALAGRGWGKTRVGAEDTVHWCLTNPGGRAAVIAPTVRDLRLVCLEGASGVAAITPPELLQGGSWSKAYNVTTGEVWFANSSKLEGFSAAEPERLRGPQFGRAWCDELAAWERVEDTWSMLRFGLRLGKDPQTIITTTPKPIPLLFQLVKDPTVYVCRGSTYENEDHLAASYLEELEKYEGTTLGRQEIHAELIDLSNSGILRRSWWKRWKDEELPRCDRVTMAIDTAYSAKQTADPSACLVMGRFLDDHERPNLIGLDGWQDRLEFNALCEKIIETARKHRPERILVEPKSAGLSVVQELRRRTELPVHAWMAKGDKLTRAHAVSSVLSAGNVWMPSKPWSDDIIDQCASFPHSAHDDYVDVVTMALEWLRGAGAAVRSDEPDPLAHERENYHRARRKRVYY